MLQKKGLILIYGISALFIALNAMLITKEFYWLSLLPVLLIIPLVTFFSLDKLLLFIVFFTPLSLNLEDMELGGIGMYLPTEPLMFGVMLLFFIRFFYDFSFGKDFWKHPITIAIIINITWIAITSLTSEMPVVSFKFLTSRLWFVICFYFLATQLFKKRTNIKRFLWLYIIPLSGVIIYTVIQHATYGFAEKPAHWVMHPFFKDHTSYGAILALFFPILFGFLFIKNISKNVKFLIMVMVLIFIVGIIFSYTRAAWISLLVSFCVFIALMLKIKFRTLILGTGILIVFFFAFQEKIFMKLEKNRQDSSDNLTEHVQSISNIATDASNLERLNRWNSALKMFIERPVFGWGPGTYMFLYAPYQISRDLTIISTNFGDRGNAHSEYIGPLAESGVFGAFSFILIVIFVIYTAIKLYFKLQDKELKILLLSTFLGLITYFIHGLLNNYLDTDKASVPFWGFIAVIVAIDIYHSKTK